LNRQEEVYSLIEKHYRSEYNKTVNKVYRIVGVHAMAEDIVQETYRRALEYWKAFPDDNNVDGWLPSILINCLKDSRKAETLSGMSDNIDDVEIIIKANGIPAVIYSEVMDRIEAKEPAVARVLKLFLVQQYSHKEIAQIVRETANNVAQIVFRFREEIRKEFKWVL